MEEDGSRSGVIVRPSSVPTHGCSCALESREISAAQDRFTTLLEEIYAGEEGERELVRMILMTVGRGGEGDVGQRIRDEILVIQVRTRKATALPRSGALA